MFYNTRKILCSNILLWLSTFVFCIAPSNYKIDNIQSPDGLVNNHVICTFQDSRGIIWFGTYAGAQSFDGNELNLINFNAKGEELFSNHVILSIVEDNNNNLWFGTEFGLNRYNYITGETEQFVHSEEENKGLSSNYIKDIVIDEEGILWLGTYGGGVVSFSEETNTFKSYQVNRSDSLSLQSNLINSLYIDSSGLLWIATENGGISVFDRKRRKIIQNFNKEVNGFKGKTVNCVFQDYYGEYWIGTWNNGLIKYSPKDKSFVNIPPFSGKNGEKCSTVKSIEQTDKDFLWIATYGDGLYRLNINTGVCYKTELQEPYKKNSKQNYIWNLYKDDKNNLWISTFGLGIFMIHSDNNHLPSYTILDSDNSRNSISCFLEDKNNQLWIGTYTSGIYIFNPNTGNYNKFCLTQGLDARINALYQDSNNNIWVCTGHGLYKILPDRNSFKVYRHLEEKPGSLSMSKVSCVTEDKNGDIWIGLWGGGINILRKDQLGYKNEEDASFEKINSSDQTNTIQNNTIWRLFNDSRGNIWILSPGKLAYYDPDNNKFNLLEVYAVSSIYETERGGLWLTSMGNGLYLLNKEFNTIMSYNETDGFPSRTLSGVLADKKGRLWMGTNQGISFLDPNGGIIANFDKNSGLEFIESNQNAYLKLSSGQMVYGGNEGFNIFTPETLGLKIFDGKVYINNINVLYESNHVVADSSFCTNSTSCCKDTIYLKPNNKVITFNFSAINFSNPEEVKYAYCLEGFDDDWHLTDSKNRSAVYTNLPPGKYIFKVKASYNAKNWGIRQASVYFEIKKPFFKTTWFFSIFIIIWLIAIIFLLKYLLFFNKKNLLSQNTQLINEKSEREKELLRLKNIELKLSIIENQEQTASLAFKNLNSIDKMETIYRNLKELEKNTSPDSQHLVKKTINLFEEDTDDITGEQKSFKTSVNLAYDNFQKKLSTAYPKLTHKDLRICSYIRMNKSNKEIAQQLNITTGSLETSRYRIRKKMELNSNTNLNDFLIKF